MTTTLTGLALREARTSGRGSRISDPTAVAYDRLQDFLHLLAQTHDELQHYLDSFDGETVDESMWDSPTQSTRMIRLMLDASAHLTRRAASSTAMIMNDADRGEHIRRANASKEQS